MFPGGIDAFEAEMLADLQKGGDAPLAPLIFLEERVYLRLALSEAIHTEAQYCK
jgi:hypothetical protein